jgi:rhodanese-related sulfurtransferase
MIKKIVTGTLLVSALAINALAYDSAKAEGFEKFFSHVTQKHCANSKLAIDADEVMKMLREKKKFTFLDIRTEGEMAVLGLKTSNTLEIPLQYLFEKKNLDRLPKDELIVLVCHSGTRATMVVSSLKMVGFKKVRVMKGGMVGIAKGDNPKNAPIK